MLPRPPFASLEREFKQGLPVIVSNDYPPAAGGLPVQGSPIHDMLRALCSLYFSVHGTSEFDAFLVEYGHLATSDVEEVARHSKPPRHVSDTKDGERL